MDFLQVFALVAGAALCALAGISFAGSRGRGAVGAHPQVPLPATPALIGAEELARLRAELASAVADLNAIRTEWRAHQKTLDSYLEAFEDLEESVERKRRRAAASASKVKPPEELEDPNSREAIRKRAQARGFRV